jgi:hypothetical protein
MKILFFCTFLFAIAFFMYLILLRIRIPSNPVTGLLSIFALVLAAGLSISCFLNKKYGIFPQGIWENLHVLIFYAPITLSFILTYAGLADDSPSMTIAQFVAQAKKNGRSKEEFRQLITDEALIFSRLKIMLKDGMVRYEKGRYCVTAKGRFFHRFFSFWTYLLYIPREG